MKERLYDLLDSLILRIKQEPRPLKLRLKYNKLLTEHEALQDKIKSELYVKFMAKMFENEKIERLQKQNKKLKEKIKNV